MPADVRGFYEYQSLAGEPWDGPAALVFADGRQVGAALDRNGFRPLRIASTADGLMAVASEVGVLPDEEHDIVDRRRLGPGEMIIVDLASGTSIGTSEIRATLARRRPYAEMVTAAVVRLAEHKTNSDNDSSASASASATATLAQRQATFGCSREE